MEKNRKGVIGCAVVVFAVLVARADLHAALQADRLIVVHRFAAVFAKHLISSYFGMEFNSFMFLEISSTAVLNDSFIM